MYLRQCEEVIFTFLERVKKAKQKNKKKKKFEVGTGAFVPGVALFLLSSLKPAVVCEPLTTLPSCVPRLTLRYSGTETAKEMKK